MNTIPRANLNPTHVFSERAEDGSFAQLGRRRSFRRHRRQAGPDERLQLRRERLLQPNPNTRKCCVCWFESHVHFGMKSLPKDVFELTCCESEA